MTLQLTPSPRPCYGSRHRRKKLINDDDNDDDDGGGRPGEDV